MSRTQKRSKPVFLKGSKIFTTLTFRHLGYIISQMKTSARYIQQYMRAYKEFMLVPELGNGRLHWHFYAVIADPFKHKVFMHNWNAKYGNSHCRLAEGDEANHQNVVNYLHKERVICSLVCNHSYEDNWDILTEDEYYEALKHIHCWALEDIHEIEYFIQELTNKYYNKEYDAEDNVINVKPKDITQWFNK